MVEVNDYHLIFDLNGVLVVNGEGQIKSWPVILRLGIKEFLSGRVKKFTMYIWSFVMKRNFLRHLEIIAKKIGVLILSSRIMDKTFYIKHDHFLLEKPNKPIFNKNLEDFI